MQSKSPEEHLWEEIQFLRNYVTSKLFPDFLRTVYGQKPKISLLSCRNCIVLVLMTFFWINYKDIRFYWIWAKKCSPVRKKINRVLAIAVQITRRTSSIKKQILRYYEIPRRFLEFGWTVYGHLFKMFLQSCRTCFVRVQRNTLRTFFDRSITNIITSGLWAKKNKNPCLPKHFQHGCGKYSLLLHTIVLTRNWNFGKTIEKWFSDSELIFIRLCQQIFGKALSKELSIDPKEQSEEFFGKKYVFICFFANGAKRTWILVVCIWQSSRICILHVQRIFSRIKCFSERKITFQSCFWRLSEWITDGCWKTLR